MGLCLFLLARALRRTRPATMGGQLALAGVGGGVGGMGYALDGTSMSLGADGMPMAGQTVDSILSGGDSGPLGLASGDGSPHTFEIIEEAFDSHLESIQHLIKSKPEMVALLMKGWLSDDGSSSM